MGRNVSVSISKAREMMVKLGMDASGLLGEYEKVEKGSEDVKDSIEDIGEEAEDTEKKMAKSAKGMGGAFEKLKKTLSGLGDVGKFVFGAVLGLGAVQAIRKIADFFREAIGAALDFEKSVFTLEVAIRGLQRIGLDTTIQGWTRYLADLKKQFPIFSEKEFVDAASLAALMTREFGFTEAQMQNIVKQSIILAQVTGKTLTESVRGITFAIGSGYFESLQRAGINISRQIIAEEALARGYEGSYTALSQNIRAMLTYEIVQNNINAIQDDAEKIMDTTVGQAQRLHAAYQDLLKDLGLLITETDSAKESLTGLALGFETLSDLLETAQGGEWGGQSILSTIFGPTFKNIMDELPVWNKQLKEWDDTLKENLALREKAAGLGDFEGAVVDPNKLFGVAGLELTQEEIDEYIEIIQDAQEKFVEIEGWGAEKRLDISEKYQKDVEDNAEAHYQKLEDLQLNYEQKLADIGLKETRAVADEEMNYAFKVAEAVRQAAFRKEEAERRYREREIQAEKRFQEKMRQLRENFLLNLEDAVRERDALQIIRLTRQYNLRKTQMERENDLSGEDRANAFQEQLRQIEQQRLERQRQMAIEHQRRLDDIARQAERERAQAQLNFERSQDDEDERWDEEKAARNEKLAEDLLDLDQEIADRNQKVLDGLTEMSSMTAEKLEQIGALYTAAYGPGSPMDRSVAYAIERLLQLRAIQAQALALFGMGTLQFGGMPQFPDQAEGGTIIANKPTTVTFGEAGIEMATFTPLNRPGVNRDRVRGSLPAGMRGRAGGEKHVVGISLTPGLEGKLIDQTMDEMSEVLVQIERARI